MEQIQHLKDCLEAAILHIRDEVLHGINDPDSRYRVLPVFNLIIPLCMTSQQIYVQFGPEASERFNKRVLNLLDQAATYLRVHVFNKDDNYTRIVDAYKKNPDDNYISLFPPSETPTGKECAISLNRMYFLLGNKLYSHLPKATRQPETVVQGIGNEYLQPVGSSKNQWGIILHFIQEAKQTHLDRPTLTKLDRGSRDLYNIICKVRRGEYKIEDLQKAIDFLSTSPVAQALAAAELSKRHHSKKS